MRSKTLLALIIASLTSSLIGNAQAAPNIKTIKVGAACKKAGTTNKVGTTTFVCTQSGSKLIWAKKIDKKKPAPIPSAAPTAESKPADPVTPAPTVAPTPETIIRNNGPKTAAGRAAAEPIYRVLNQVALDLYRRSQSVPKADVKVYSDELNNPLVGSTKEVVIRTTEMMRAIASDFPNNELYLFRSFTWFENSSIKDVCPNLIKNQKEYGWANAGCNKYWVGDFAYYDNPQNYKGQARHTSRTLLGFTGAHETAHLIQSGNMNGNHEKFPAWYREGSASVAAGLVMVSMSEFANGDYAAVDDWENNSWSKPRCKAVFDNWKVKNEAAGHGLTNNCEYSVGRRMIEYLVAKDKTFDNIRKVYDSVGPNMSFNEAFKKYHGMELSQFFTEIESWLEQLDWAVASTY